ncbi:hypothetical protein [Brachybacterium massiliense]|uniref:hypothetical protein n=1 Tax=Brachybacterium massiliense TaxID=1755098 RepID=UPI00111E878B|nr:hypothetical protein [Brachybacterium massiliense]
MLISEGDDDHHEPLSTAPGASEGDEGNLAERGPEAEDPGQGAGEHSADASKDREEDQQQALSRVEDGSDEELTEADQRVIELAMVAAQVAIERSESFSGLLPAPKDWERYGPEWHERIMQMSESFTTHESARRDRVVDATIDEAPKSRRTAAALAMIAMVLAFVAGVVFRQPWLGAAFITMPVMLMVQAFLPERESKTSHTPTERRGSSRSPEEDER